MIRWLKDWGWLIVFVIAIAGAMVGMTALLRPYYS